MAQTTSMCLQTVDVGRSAFGRHFEASVLDAVLSLVASSATLIGDSARSRLSCGGVSDLAVADQQIGRIPHD
jgi:hypothetical protein